MVGANQPEQSSSLTPGGCSGASLGSDSAVEQFQCPLCPHSPLSRAGLLCHVTASHGEQLVAVCKICQQLFSSSEIQAHVLRCKGAHVCPYCRSTFALSSYLQRHIHRRHYSSLVRPICDSCGKTFSSVAALSLHRQLHSGEFSHSCDLCGALFAQKLHVKLHLDSHHAYVELFDSPKPFNCATCGRGFLFSVSLQCHRLQHTKLVKKSKPPLFYFYFTELICTTCGKQFAYRSEFERHKTTHSKKMPHQCPFCSQSFSRPSLLRIHILRHTDPASLTCPYCLHAYASRSYLAQHIEKHKEMSDIQQPPSVSSMSSTCSVADVELGALSDGCGISTIGETLIDHVLSSENCTDVLDGSGATHLISPNVNFLHAVLYGTSS
ncbi:unnamed protein product [Calicophoron daubneyi]|uniref:C2H2-type domain-containing protein n=1 Tax=Calicophoron daubneyi TaxID=300641 RepID=A0AAV2TG74_CALDB